jgi:hypothetical protein
MEERLFRSRFHAYGVVLYRRSPKSKSGKAEWHVRAAPEFPNVAAFLTLASRFTTVSDPNAGSR